MKTLKLSFIFLLLSISFTSSTFAQSKGELVCQNISKYASGGWNFARKIYGGDGKKYPGTRNIICSYANRIYEIGGAVTIYQCKEKGYVECTFKEMYDITDISYPAGKKIKVTYNKGNNYLHYDRDEEKYKAPLPVPEKEEREDGLLDHSVDLSNRDKWEEWFENYSEHISARLVHKIGREGEDVCRFGKPFAEYSIRYGPDHKVVLDKISNMTLNPLEKGDVAGAGNYDESLFLPLKDPKARHCMKIEYTRDSTGFTKFPRWHDFNRIHGEVNSYHSGIQYIISGKTVTANALKACCDDGSGQCLGYVPAHQACSMGTSRPGLFGDGSYTPCTICAKPEPVPVSPIAPPEEKEEDKGSGMAIGCCIDGQCRTRPSLDSCIGLGEPLWPARVCPSDGSNPCAKAPPPPPEPDPEPDPVPPQVPGACMFKDGSCRDVPSADVCWNSPNHHMFLKNSACQVNKQGGCCDGVNPCFLSSYSQCNGEFFEHGCPATCPPLMGRCLKYCNETHSEKCKTVSKFDCAQVGGQQFFPKEQCAFESETLGCDLQCANCMAVVGSYKTNDGTFVFQDNCTGQQYIPDRNLPVSFTYDCKDTRDINVHFEDNKPSLYLQLIIDGSQRLLRYR